MDNFDLEGRVLNLDEVGIAGIGLRLHVANKEHKSAYLLSLCGRWIYNIDFLPITPICRSCFGRSGTAEYTHPPNRLVVVHFYEEMALDV